MSASKNDQQKKVPDQGGVGFTGGDAKQGNAQGAGQANRQRGDPGANAGKSNGGAWRSDVPDQSGVGFLPDDDGKPQGGTQQSGNQQSGQPSNQQGHQAESGIHSNFAHASPESLVNPPGAPQSGAGSIAGRDDVPGGVSSQIQASRNAQSGAGPAAAGGNPGTPQDDGRYGVNANSGAGRELDS